MPLPKTKSEFPSLVNANLTLEIYDADYGCVYHSLDKKNANEFITDPEKYMAGYWGVTKEDFYRWRNRLEEVQCSAITKKGKQCNNFLETRFINPSSWLAVIENPLCTVHK